MDAIYARQSIDKKGSLSIEGQIELCRKFTVDDALVFSDKGFSGKNTKRPAFGELMEAVEAVLRYGFTALELQRIWCGHYAGNWRSKRTMEKCGFRYQFARTEFVRLMGETRQSYFYLLTKESWRERLSGAI